MTVSRNQRHLKRTPCPVCKGFDEAPRGTGQRCCGFTSNDGWVHCSRDELAGAISQGSDGLYAHRPAGLCKCGQEHAPVPESPDFESVYDYRDESGVLVFQVIRKVGKKFLQRKPDGFGGWEWKTAGMRMVLYRLPQLLAADPSTPVVIVEGEKDADRGALAGLVTTSPPRGAGKWGPVAELGRTVLAGRDVIIIADKDAIKKGETIPLGLRHAREVEAALTGAARSVRVVQVPGDGKDLADFLNAGGDPAVLLAAPSPSPDVPPPVPPAPPSEPELPDLEPPAGFFDEYDDRETSPLDGDSEDTKVRLTEYGNAQRLVRRFGSKIRFCPGRGWFAWDGQRWKTDTTGAILRLAKLVVRSLWLEATTCDETLRGALREHARKSEKASAISAMVKLAESEPGISVEAGDFDPDPWVLNVANGLLDLRTFALRAHDPLAMCAKIAPVEFDPEAVCPVWIRFLSEVLPDPEVRTFVHRFVGYCLSGSTRERIFVMLLGGGRNGKSLFVRVLVRLLGEYALYAAPDLLMATDGKNPQHPTALADLAGVRFAALSETKKGRAFNEETLKRLTGDEPIKARFMGRDFFQFEMQAKLALATNGQPRVTDGTNSFWDRLREIPFNVRVARGGARVSEGTPVEDKALFAKLCAELPGILAWAVEGCRAWQAEAVGLTEPAAVIAASKAYRDSQDPFSAFLDERVTFGKPTDLKLTVPRSALLAAYVAWCQTADRHPAAASELVDVMRTRGCVDGALHGARFWRGAALRGMFDPAPDRPSSSDSAPGGKDPSDPLRNRPGAEGALGAALPQLGPHAHAYAYTTGKPLHPLHPLHPGEILDDDDDEERAAIQGEEGLQ